MGEHDPIGTLAPKQGMPISSEETRAAQRERDALWNNLPLPEGDGNIDLSNYTDPVSLNAGLTVSGETVFNGAVAIDDEISADAVVIPSQNGTAYRITVTDSGALVTTEV